MILLPYPPSTNRYWRSFRGRMVRSKHAVEYKAEVQQIAAESGLELRAGPVAVTLLLHPVQPQDWARREKREGKAWVLGVRRVDLDNAVKVCLDALQGVAYEDDRQITSLSVGLGDPLEGGGLSVFVDEDAKWKVA